MEIVPQTHPAATGAEVIPSLLQSQPPKLHPRNPILRTTPALHPPGSTSKSERHEKLFSCNYFPVEAKSIYYNNFVCNIQSIDYMMLLLLLTIISNYYWELYDNVIAINNSLLSLKLLDNARSECTGPRDTFWFVSFLLHKKTRLLHAWEELSINICQVTSLSSFKSLLKNLICHDAYKDSTA